MANTLQIKRNTTNSNAPQNQALAKGELGYTVTGNSLYVGSPSDGNTITLSDGTFLSGNTLVLSEDTNNGVSTVTLAAPSISDDIVLTFPSDLSQADGKIIVVDTDGNMSFQNASITSLNGLEDVDGSAPTTNDVLQYDNAAAADSKWKHITMSELATSLGYSGATETTFADMIVNGDLIVSGNVTLDTEDVLTKDKVVAIGVSGGIKEGVISTDGSTATVTSANGASALDTSDKIWVDGNGTNLTSGIYTVTSSADNNTITFATTQNATGRVYHSLSPVTDTVIDGAGFTIKGASDKKFKWTKKNGNDNPYFELTDGNLSIGETSLFLDGVEALVNGVSGTALGTSVSVDASKITAELDGGEY